MVVEWLSNNALNPVRTPASRRLLNKRKRLAAGRARVSAHVVQTRNGTNKESSASVWQLFDQGWWPYVTHRQAIDAPRRGLGAKPCRRVASESQRRFPDRALRFA